MKKILLSMMTLVGLTMSVMATNPVVTAMPSLTIAPDAHAAGMGDIGAATNPDLNSQHWNPSKYAFMQSKGGLTVNYTPWLRSLVGDIDLAYIAGYYNMGDMAGTISGSFRYFSMGEVSLIDDGESILGTARPNEWALDVAYSRKLHEYLSMAVALRFMYSDMNNGSNTTTDGVSIENYPAWTFAADLSLYYRQPIATPMGESYFALGFNLSNLGGKMTYDEGETQHFVPANMRLGVSYELPFDDYNRLMISAEANKMLVPTSQSKFAVDANGEPLKDAQQRKEWYDEVSSPNGWWMSFCDAPGYYNDQTDKHISPAMEELQEIQWAIGLEYSYNRQFFGRIGYSHENYYKGNRRYLTLGAGFKLSIFSLDFAYCLATAPTNPLNGTMRFTLGFDLAGIKDLVNNAK